jgi:glycosyltransferase involved in cell wall biosynthesis
MNNNKPIKAMFLYTELAEYNQACFRAAIKEGNEIFIIRYPINEEAPFNFNNKAVSDKLKNSFSSINIIIDYVKTISPDVIIISGWKDKDYLNVASYFYNKIPTVLAFDNKWKGSIKQHLSRLISNKLLLDKFSHAWVPGKKQEQFALKLGFLSDKILQHFYSCDYDNYHNIYKTTYKEKTKNYPKAFLFIGRYIKSKGIFELWKAFVELCDNNNNNNWKLICVGTGEEWENRVIHENISHLNFVQAKDMLDVYKRSGVYVMPSLSEPWGVSLHEAVSAGLPVISSNNVGSSEVFLKENINGFSIKAGSYTTILKAMIKFTKMNDEQLLRMNKESVNLSKKITPNIWASKLKSIG